MKSSNQSKSNKKNHNHSNAASSQLAHRVTKSMKLLESAGAALGDFSAELTADDKQRLAKPRPNIATVVPAIAQIAERHGVVIPKHSTQAMTASLATYATLFPLRQSVAGLLKKIDDAMTAASASAWGSALAYYTVLRRVSSGGDQIAQDLLPVASYFAKGAPHSKTKKPATPKPPVADAPVTAHDSAPAVSPPSAAKNGGSTIMPASSMLS